MMHPPLRHEAVRKVVNRLGIYAERAAAVGKEFSINATMGSVWKAEARVVTAEGMSS